MLTEANERKCSDGSRYRNVNSLMTSMACFVQTDLEEWKQIYMWLLGVSKIYLLLHT